MSVLVPALICGFCMQNSDIWTSSQVSIGSKPHLSVCAYKTAWSEPELLVYMGSSPNLWFCAFKTATLGSNLHVSMGPRHHLWFCAWKTACQASELLVSMGRSPHVWFWMQNSEFWTGIKSIWVPHVTCHFVHANQRDLHQNDKSIWVPFLICGSFHANQRL